MVRLVVCLGLLVMAGLPSPVDAQQPGAVASIRGRAIDPQQRGVPATIRVVQLSNGLTRESQADADGYFAITSLPPGTIDLIVTAPGFAERRVTGVRLEVGQAAEVEVPLQLSPIEEQLTVAGDAGTVDVLGSVVGSVISAREIESLPLNGRNFLELAFLTPGSAPAANFDPTKAQSVLVSSAGQAGRGGNITIDGMDDNDDVVGGPLQNVPQDAVQEFQVATNRFSAELGRSAGSVINVVTRSGGDVMRGSGAGYFRNQDWQALPATLDPDIVDDPPFDRQQVSFTLGGPLSRQKLFAFGALEVRNQDGGIQVGIRDTAARTIRNAFAPAPLDDLLTTLRVDWRASAADDLTLRYSGQREEDISSSALDRAIGTASQRQESRNQLHSVLATWTRVLSSRAVNSFSVSYSNFDNTIVPVEPGVQHTFPSIQAGSSFRVPQGRRSSGGSSPTRCRWFAGRISGSWAASCSASTRSSISECSATVASSSSRTFRPSIAMATAASTTTTCCSP